MCADWKLLGTVTAHSPSTLQRILQKENYFSWRNFSKVVFNSCKPMACKDAWYVLIGHKVSLLLLKLTASFPSVKGS